MAQSAEQSAKSPAQEKRVTGDGAEAKDEPTKSQTPTKGDEPVDKDDTNATNNEDKVDDDDDDGEEDEDEEEEEVYVVEKILKHRTVHGKMQFFLKWQGYPDSENTWEDEDNIFSPELIEEYWQQYSQKNKGISNKRKRTTTKPSLSAEAEDFPRRNAASWENDIECVEHVEMFEDGLYVHLRWKNGQFSAHPAVEANRKCPQKIIAFYEKHLRFKPPTEAS